MLEEILQEIEDMRYPAEGVGCGLEDVGITDRYEAAAYGFEEARERIVEVVRSHSNELWTYCEDGDNFPEEHFCGSAMERLTKSELVNGFPVCYPQNNTGLPEYVMKENPYREIVEKLKNYEDFEEHGRLLKLPCDIGQRVYEIYRFLDYGAWEIDVHEVRLEDLDKIGRTVFLTRKEAEAAVKKREGN